MKIVFGLLVAALFLTDLDKIGKINSLKSEAKKAYLGGDYETAIKKYRYLVDSMGVKEDEVLLNLANSYFELRDTAQIANAYLPLTQSSNAKIKSLANQQLGVASNRQGKSEEALNHFKQALKADPTNEDARFNYEIVKKKVEEKKKKEQEQDKNNSQEPSEFAKKLKAQADELVSKRLYKDAYNLMNEGLKKDNTVSHYQEFIKRTKEVADIK